MSTSTLDPKLLGRIRALLAKAESSTFPEEAEALSAKAQELMSRHAIEAAMLGSADEPPTTRQVVLVAPYIRPKFLLLARVAEANRCHAVFHSELRSSTLVGYPADLQTAELLYTSLLVQATGAILAAGTQTDGWQNTTRSWRNSFWVGYAGRIGERLARARDQAAEDASTRHGDALLPVLAQRSAEVDRERDRQFPHLRPLRASVSNGDGLFAGRRFADRARLSTEMGKRQTSALRR